MTRILDIFTTFIGLLVIRSSVATTYNEDSNPTTPNNRPVIGILAQEVYNGENPIEKAYIAASYVKYIEGAGAQVVPIMINKSEEYYRHLFNQINGVLFPGGAILFEESIGQGGFVDAGLLLYKLAKEANDNGDYFPVWGTCLGFEFMVFAESYNSTGKDVRVKCNANNIATNLKFTKETKETRLFGSAPKSVVKTLAKKPVTVNFHHYCVPQSGFLKMPELATTYTIGSLNYDNTSKLVYVSSIESKRYPFYAVQFHPEKNLYEWTTKENIPHSFPAIQSAQYFANFFVNEARKSQHHFSNQREQQTSLIYNYSPTYTGAKGATMVQMYFFPLNQ